MLLAMLGGQLAIGALNEWRDRADDAVSKPDKPIPRGEVSPRGALAMVAGGLALMVTGATPLGRAELVVLSLAIGCGIVYDLWAKRTPLSWLPYLVALPLVPIWAWQVMAGFEPQLLWLYPIGALLIVAIHLAQSLPDIAGDRRQGQHGLAVVLGQRRATALLWGAGFLSAAIVGAGAAIVGARPLPGMLAAALVAALLLGALALGPRARPRLFELLAACAILLALGWTVSLG